MTVKAFRDLIILVVFFGGIILAFVFVRRQFPESTTLDMESNAWKGLADEQAEKLGSLLLEEFAREGLRVEDAFVDSNLQIIYDRLLSEASLDKHRVTFHVFHVDGVNAFTLPGGHVVILTGLIDFCEQPEHLAAVVAHELGHVHHGHVVERMVNEIGLSLMLSALSGGDPTLIHELVAMSVSSAFSRSQETEADEYAHDLLASAGIDPRIMAEFFESLNEEDLSYSESFEWVMSHPHNDKRIERSHAYRPPDNMKVEPIEMDWDELKSRLRDF